MGLFAVFVFLLCGEFADGEETVVLPCQYSGVLPEVNPTVIWKRYDLNPPTVHLRREEDDLPGQNQLFIGRTSMKSDALDSGDFSLTLRKPHFSDSGTYTCSISDGRDEFKLRDVQLEVKASEESYMVKVEVEEGAESVVLPCQYNQVLEEIVTVKWSRPDLNPSIVHQRQEGNDLQFQNQLFSGRTSMRSDALDSGNFSLTLSEVQISDIGNYICSMIDEEEEKTLSEVELLLKASQDSLTKKVEVQWVDSVVLPCQYSQPLEEMVTVKWSRHDLNPDTVHQRREGDDLESQNELFKGRTSMRADAFDSGDFSLTLSELQLSDSGNYTCSMIDDEEKETTLSEVHLLVKRITTGVKVLLVLLGLLIFAVCGGLLYYFRNIFRSVSARAKILLGVLVVLVVLAVSGGFLFFFQHKFKSEIPTWAILVEFLLFFFIIDLGFLLLFRQQYNSETSTCSKSFLVLCALLLLVYPKVVVSLLFHFRHSTSESSARLRPFLTFLTFLTPLILPSAFCVPYVLTILSQQGVISGYHDLILQFPIWARIFLILSVLLFITIEVGLLFHFRQQFITVYRVEVDSGVESVLLPFKTAVNLSTKDTVTWTHNTGRMVYKYCVASKSSLRLEEQHRQYRDRTVMEKKFEFGDLSLTLKNPTDRDTGTYSCTVYRGRKIQAKKQVLLTVRAGSDSLIIAMDFGSGFSGYSFNVKPRQEGGETQIKRWSNGLGLDTPKTPTCILFDEHGEFMKFGYEAKTAFNNMRGEEAEKHYFLENVNMDFCDRDISRQTIEAANNNKSMSTQKVLTEVLRFLKDDALKTIRSHPEGGEFTASDFTWVMTVPDILDQSAKRFIIKSAVQAGLVTDDTKDKLMFVLESEAALTCLKLQPDGFITQNHSRDSQDQPGAAEPETSCKDPPESQEAVKFMAKPEETVILLETQRDGKRYLVVYGDENIYFTIHEVLEGGDMKTLYKVPKDNLGGKHVEGKFKQFLGEIFSDGVWDEYEQKFPNEVQKMMFDFICLNHLDEDVQISCPGNLVMLAEKQKEIQTFFDSVKGASWDDGSIRISREKLKTFYDETLQRITESLRETLDKNLNIGFIVLVGGFAESQILRQNITDQVGPQYKVLVPLRPQEVILKGAVDLGRNSEMVEPQRKRPAWLRWFCSE